MEQQIFNHLPWEGVLELVKWAEENCDKNIFPIIGTRFFSVNDIKNLPETEIPIARQKIGAAAKSGQAWYKNINGGEVLGEVIMKYYVAMDDENPLKREINSLLTWIEKK